MKNLILGKRLLSVSSMVRRGAVLADIGTDHAYLPIYLLKSGIISFAVCSDINDGPLKSARENLLAEGLLQSVRLVKASGACGLSGQGITDYTVCGMGGELIAEIIETSPHLKDSSLNLILQPMTKHEALRSYLWEHGFTVDEEKYSLEDGKRYVALKVRYIGERVDFSPLDAYFGKALGDSALWDSEKLDYVKARAASLEKIAEGKKQGGVSCREECELLLALDEKYGFKACSK